ncbi:MAG: hypothetical protein KQI35_17230 [Bacteroidetes bacterium]|nr:hypothetical protein [Bacteroidota bacterium]
MKIENFTAVFRNLNFQIIFEKQHLIKTLLILFSFFSLHLSAQDYYKIIGKQSISYPDFILRFEILDLDTHVPINNARIFFKDKYGRTQEAFTNDKGIVLFIYYDGNQFEDGTFEVSISGYKYKSLQVDRYDITRYMRNHGFYMTQQEPWSDANSNSIQKIISALINDNYTPAEWTGGPDLYEFDIKLQKIYQNQPYSTSSKNEQSDYSNTSDDLSSYNSQEKFLNSEWLVTNTLSDEQPKLIKFISEGKTIYIHRNGASENIPWRWNVENGYLCINEGNGDKLIFKVKDSQLISDNEVFILEKRKF